MNGEERVYTGREFVNKWNGNGGVVGWVYDNRGKVGVILGTGLGWYLNAKLPAMIQSYQINSAKMQAQYMAQAFKELGMFAGQPAQQLIATQPLAAVQPLVAVQQTPAVAEANIYQTLLESMNTINQKVDSFGNTVNQKFDDMGKRLFALETTGKVKTNGGK